MLRQLAALATLVLTLGVATAPAGAADPPEGSVEDFLARELPASGVPGLAYAVVDADEITTVDVRGVVRKGGAEVEPDTAFLTGSISKSFTALSVLQLVEAGEVELDAPVSEYLDAFVDQPAAEVTLRQLLSHTSGYSTLQGNSSHADETGGPDELERRVDRLAEARPAHEAGGRWEYSNANYLVLGRLLEVVSGQDYQTYVTTHILEPVGMTHSFVSDGAVHPSMATGHRPWFGTKRPLAENTTSRGMAPAGGIVASAGDLARYLQMMMNNQDDLVSADHKALMMRSAGEVAPYYGLGWYVDPADGSVGHTGTSPGFESLALMVPDQRTGVVVLTNGGSGVGFGETTDLLYGIAARELGLEYDDGGSRWAQKALFLTLVLLPFGYLLCMVWAWRHRSGIRRKAGNAFGRFSLWFPLLSTLVAAWVVLHLVPTLIGSPLANIRLYQPDLGLAMTATAVGGVVWSVFRLGVAYTGRSRSA